MLCRRCGTRLTPVYPNQDKHPNCDPDAETWTDAQLDYWEARARERRARENTPAE